jgi:PAS domain S-box-containing protein
MASSTQSNGSSAAKMSASQFRRRYFLALSLIAILVIVSQAMIQWLIASQSSDSSIINIAGRQRMLSQKITKLTYYISETSSIDSVSRHRKELEDTVRLWQRSHDGLVRGDPEMGLPRSNSVAAQELFEQLQPHQDAMVNAAWAILSSTDGAALGQSIQEIRRHEADFLKIMNDITFLYDREAHDKVEVARWFQLGLMCIMLLALVLEARLIFAPVTRRIERDMQELADSKQDIEQLAWRFGVATEAARVGIWDYDIVANILFWDDLMFSLYGISPESFSGAYEAWQAGLHPDDVSRGDAEIAAAIAGTKNFDTSFRVVWPNGEIRWIRAVAMIQRDQQGAALRMIGTNWDITEQKQAELAKSEFVSTVSHELRTPLTSIKGSLELITSGALGEPPVQMKVMLDIACRNAVTLSCLINDLLDFEKIEACKLRLELQTQALQPLIEQAVDGTRAFGERLNVGFHLDACNDAIEVHVDGNRLKQVLVNLLSNAAKFSPIGGQVEVSVSRMAMSVRVSVTDHGPGIPDEFRQRIFQRFSQADSSDTRKQGGSGLGLVISKELIEGMNGLIGFTSVAGEGACFYIELPIY